MRLWSLHPKYLDVRGLTACWREGLLARKVLLGETRGYKDHPQLERFKATSDPILFIDTYLHAIVDEASSRGYKFDRTKLASRRTRKTLPATDGQIAHEIGHLASKLAERDPDRLALLPVNGAVPHPLFSVIPGDVESWERVVR